jgi:hypothetical protein
MACGLTVRKGKEIDNFISAVLKDCGSTKKNISPNMSQEEGRIDAKPAVSVEVSEADYDEEINLASLSDKELSEIIKLISPCGPLNEKPKFLIRNITLLDINRREFKNKTPKKNNMINCYFTLNIAGSSASGENSEIKHRAMMFNRHGAIENILGSSDSGKNKITVDGIIFEFFNGYIKILNFI